MAFIKREPSRFLQRGVYIRPGQDPMIAFKKLTRMLKDEGILDELRDRESYVKPSARRKNRKAKAVARERRRQHSQKINWGPVPTQTPTKSVNKGKNSKKQQILKEMDKNAKVARRDSKKSRPKTR